MAWVPDPLRSEILGARGRSSQMGYCWHESAGEPHLWASQQAVATLQPRPGSSVLHVPGMLPPGPEGFNRLEVWCNGTDSGEVVNRDRQMLEFGGALRMPLGAREPWEIEFRTEYVHQAADDQLDLGFALAMAASLPSIDPGRVRRQRAALDPLLVAIAAADRVGRAMRSRFRHERANEKWLAPLAASGLTVLIPERDNPGELAECLAGLEVARRRWREPLQIIVLVNGAAAFQYRRLQEMHQF